jgi:hypothetical protein
LPARTKPRIPTNADLARDIAAVGRTASAAALAASEAATIAAQTATAATQGVVQILGRVDHLERVVTEAGLNGHTDLLKSFLEQYAATYTQRQAWQTVKSDIGHRLHWLSSPKAWVKAFFYAGLGGLGWKLVSGIPFPHL